MNINYKEECKDYELMLNLDNYQKKELNDSYDYICEYLLNINIPFIPSKNINYGNLQELFTKSIKKLSINTQLFYKDIIKEIQIIKTNMFENGYAQIIGNSKIQKIYITKKHLQEIDFACYSHELGHVPYLRNGARKDYYEYSEVLPIFLEYLSWLSINEDNAFNNFIKVRFQSIKLEAEEFLKASKQDYYENEYHHNYLDYLKRDYLKYILSFDYVLNLINVYKEDNDYVVKLIDSIVCGYSTFKEEENILGIDSKCKKLIDESKKYI